MSVVHIAGEHADYAHTGGLGEVLAGLTRAQAQLGSRVTVILPGYAEALARFDGERRGNVEVELPWGVASFAVFKKKVDGVFVEMLAEPAFFGRPGLYGPPEGGAYSDNPVRYTAFGRAALERALYTGGGPPDVLHGHDWHAGLAVAAAGRRWPRPALLMTVHNLAFQGAFSARAFEITGLAREALDIDGVLHMGQVNPLKAGLQHADLLTTVSPTYARELCTPEGGWSLHGLFRWRGDRLVGITNGVDAPSERPKPSERPAFRAALCEELGLEAPSGPLFAMTSRLSSQKGVDLLIEALPPVLSRGAAAIVLGTGDAALTAALRELHETFPKRFAFVERFDPELADRVHRGVDAVVVPSRFEPCGTAQLHGMARGALPVVRRTGGLADTVRDLGEGGWGFVFDAPTAGALEAALVRVAEVHDRDPDAWRLAQRRGLERPVGWDAAARAYDAAYRKALELKPK